jgi:hypothetical protein
MTTGEMLAEGRPSQPSDETSQIAKLSQGERAKQRGVSKRTQEKLDALARQRPDLLEEV